MKRFLNCFMALGVGLVMPVLIWVGAGSAMVQAKRMKASPACSLDSDCPPGFVCVNGRCVARS
ncbi:MAG: hypothetical protein HYX96_05555 [Chloroflexi bacterium]|nr:hypothetical protein [Chloroflexota bacterium]